MSSILKVDQLQDSGGNAIITSDGSGNITTGTGMGKVLQVVQGSNASSVNTTSTSFVDITSVTASITPISTSNKIMVIYSSDALYSLVSATNVTYFHQVLRDSTSLGERAITSANSSGGLQARGAMSFTILDSPNTTSSVTYKAQHKVSNGSSTGQALDTSIVLMEVSA